MERNLFGLPIFRYRYERTWWRLFQKRVVRTNLDIYVLLVHKAIFPIQYYY